MDDNRQNLMTIGMTSNPKRYSVCGLISRESNGYRLKNSHYMWQYIRLEMYTCIQILGEHKNSIYKEDEWFYQTVLLVLVFLGKSQRFFWLKLIKILGLKTFWEPIFLRSKTILLLSDSFYVEAHYCQVKKNIKSYIRLSIS